MGKALSNAMWLVVAAVVALVVALLIITVVSRGTESAENQGTSIIDLFGNLIGQQSCAKACEQCKQLKMDACKLPDKCKDYECS